MAKSSSRPSPQIPTKWAVAVVAALIVYALVQPLVNRQFGWQLPSLAAVMGQAEKPASRATPSPASDDSPASKSVPSGENSASQDPPQSSSSAIPSDTGSPAAEGAESDSQGADGLLFGLLRETAAEDYLSPAGLRYTRGSEEGHRLKHLERHLEDQPDRPGSHGVFYGDMPQIVRWLDESYTRATRGEKGTSRSDEGSRQVIEASFSKPVGFLGGQTGRREQNPDLRRVRMVLEGNRVITAFPVK
jgi:hypothetical protein